MSAAMLDFLELIPTLAIVEGNTGQNRYGGGGGGKQQDNQVGGGGGDSLGTCSM